MIPRGLETQKGQHSPAIEVATRSGVSSQMRDAGNRFLIREWDFARQRRDVMVWRGRLKARGWGKPDLCLGSNQSIIEIKYQQRLPQWKNQANWLFDLLL